MMVLPSKPPKKKALLIAIQHVHRKTDSDLGTFPDLEFAHRDAKELRANLIASHGYQADDIILMIDDVNHPEHLWPTQKRILHQIDVLTSDAPEDGHFFLYYSGHGLEVQAQDRASMRADGRDDEIVAADGKPILDYILHDRLIEPLQKVKGSKLFALFDCCHSESLLDLQRSSGPNRYSRVWNVGPGQMFKDLSTVVANLSKLNKEWKRKDAIPAPRQSSSQWSGVPTYKTEEVGELSVICLSACRDGQLAYDDCGQGLTFTKSFMNAMAEKPGITWTELRDALKEFISEIQTSYEAYMQDTSSESDGSHGPLAQEPRFSTSSHTDLTRTVSF